MEAVKRLYTKSDIPMYGINKLINPRKNEAYSPNLYKFLTYGKNKVFTNVFIDTKGKYYLGIIQDNGIGGAAKLNEIACYGCKAKVFSYGMEDMKKWKDVSVEFWTKYVQKGRGAFINIWWNYEPKK